MADGELSARELAQAHLSRIESLDDTHNAIIELNPEVLEIAAALDGERAGGAVRGQLHGIPMLLKDNIDTGDNMQTSAGSLALAGTRADSDSAVAARLRRAGVVILGKTNLSEWANFRSTRSSSGWSSQGGQTRNAYDPLRTPGGSSSGSGVATALGMCAAAIGTETDGSIVSPSAMNGIVGIKPTVGAVSRSGIIPISHSQDTAGPMARSVRDAALVLAAILGSDPGDAATAQADTRVALSRGDLDANALRGARLGVARSYCGYHDRLDTCFEAALRALRDCGATIVDPVHLAPMTDIRPHERVVMETEFRAGLNAYLAARSPAPPIRDLEALVIFNAANAQRVMPHFDQDILESCLTRGGLDGAEYRDARSACVTLAAVDGIDAALRDHRLDAILAPTTTPAWLIDWVAGDNRRGSAACAPAVAGYPHVTVPMGQVAGLPVGLSIMGAAWSDWRLMNFAHSFEQHTHHRAPASAG
jgi:amidase